MNEREDNQLKPIEKTETIGPNLPEPHLVDANSVSEVAKWLATAIIGGIMGNLSYDLFKGGATELIHSWKRRHGGRKLKELESKVVELAKSVKRKPGVSNHDIELRVREIFRSLES